MDQRHRLLYGAPVRGGDRFSKAGARPDQRGAWLACGELCTQAHFGVEQYEEAAALLRRRILRKPDTDLSRVLLAACYGYLGRTEEARALWAEARRINPNYSLDYQRRILPYKDASYFERVIEGLRKAGLPQ
jgi:tetratricopeptide (TPR) repeat protein